MTEHPLMDILSSLVRGCIVAPPGRKLVVADLAGIEARMLAWLAGEQWKLQAFRDFDNGIGADLYKLDYAKSFQVPVEEVTKEQRSIGKVMTLMLGYAGGVGAFLTGAATYGFDIEDLGLRAYGTLPGWVREEAHDFYAWAVRQKRSTFGLSERAFVVCDGLKRLWRAAHPNVVTFWSELQAACVGAVERPGHTAQCRRLKVRRDGAWLRVVLPSGRALCYPQPKVEDGQLSYMGTNQYSRKWERIRTYSGKLVENCTQAAARDVLAGSMPEVEAAGYSIVLHVHDEIITETPDSPEFTADGLAEIMSRPPEWAPDIPLAAAGFEAYRYRKG
jgi:DNA polymerase